MGATGFDGTAIRSRKHAEDCYSLNRRTNIVGNDYNYALAA